MFPGIRRIERFYERFERLGESGRQIHVSGLVEVFRFHVRGTVLLLEKFNGSGLADSVDDFRIRVIQNRERRKTLGIGGKRFVVLVGYVYEGKGEVDGSFANREPFSRKVFFQEERERKEFRFADDLSIKERFYVRVQVLVEFFAVLFAVIMRCVDFRKQRVIAVFDRYAGSRFRNCRYEGVRSLRFEVRIAPGERLVIRKVVRLPYGGDGEGFEFLVDFFHRGDRFDDFGDAVGRILAFFRILAPLGNREIPYLAQEPAFEYGGFFLVVHEIPAEILCKIGIVDVFRKTEYRLVRFRKEFRLVFFKLEILSEKRERLFVGTGYRISFLRIFQIEIPERVHRGYAEDVGVFQFGVICGDVSEKRRREYVRRRDGFFSGKKVDREKRRNRENFYVFRVTGVDVKIPMPERFNSEIGMLDGDVLENIPEPEEIRALTDGNGFSA